MGTRSIKRPKLTATSKMGEFEHLIRDEGKMPPNILVALLYLRRIETFKFS